MKRRCAWARNPLAIAYHDKEWGVPVRNDRKLFEFLILEGAQAGLSWDTILAKRANYRRAFHGFNAGRIALYGAKDRARCFLAVKKECGSFSKYAWELAGRGADEFSKDLKRRGFKFVGPTIMYAFMQAVGMVNDHERGCFRRREIDAKN